MESVKTCRVGIGIFMLILLVTAVPAGAAVRTWDDGGTGSEWATAGNWNPNGYSNSDNLTVLSGSPTSAVHVSADNGGSITLNGLAAMANFSYGLSVGLTTSTGALSITNGGAVSSTNSYVGAVGSGSSGTATVSGTGSRWTNSGYLRVGNFDYAKGTLIITGGGAVSNTIGYVGYDEYASGEVTVDGTGSTWTNSSELFLGMYVGTKGTLNITNGGEVSSEFGSLGHFAYSSGIVTVSGAGSTWTNSGSGGLTVGGSGTGTLNILNGGLVSNTNGFVGRGGTNSSTVTVSGAGSRWTNSGYLSVGYSGTGTLSITDGGVVSNTAGHIGYNNDSSGTATVSGAGSTWTNSSTLSVGRYNKGTLIITDGGAVSNTNSYLGYSGYGSGSSGTVTVSGTGSTWTNSGGLYVGGNETSVGGTGNLTIDGGAVNVVGTMKIWSTGTVNIASGALTAAVIDHTAGGAFNFTGGLLSIGTFQGNLINNDGTISAGSSPGLMTVTGDLTMISGGILSELAGTVHGTEYDAIDVAGALTAAGTLDVVLYDGFMPANGDAFDLLNWGSLTGTFNTVNLPGLSGGLAWDDSNLYSSGEITVVPEPASATILLLGTIAVLRRRKK